MELSVSISIILKISILFSLNFTVHGGIWNVWNVNYWRCVLKKIYECPDNNIRYYLYTPETGTKRLTIDIRNPYALNYSGYDYRKKNAIIIHGFNGTESRTPITILRNAYISRKDYNVFTIDWSTITPFPCYISALSNTRLVGQCGAKFYAYIMENGGDARKTTCIGHSLGAHICGMMSNHLDKRQHKIVGLDPARPLIDRYANKLFKLSTEDANHVQVIHTNAGFLGEVNQVGHVDFCVNGGRFQPSCYGTRLQRARCSHFQSACYFAQTVRYGNSIMGRPCKGGCPKMNSNWGFSPGKPIPMGEDTPFGVTGSYCVQTNTFKDCPYFQ
ncbi:phospholipase A1-like [Diorhabda carinulata]|uniref:phospholipase A1-like n=1 Tax=Diorhabda carinulata TaxID=1163345 RepID=UPI0025A2D675|nr:phospholipase A1-like [Diorhabda carinulata]